MRLVVCPVNSWGTLPCPAASKRLARKICSPKALRWVAITCESPDRKRHNVRGRQRATLETRRAYGNSAGDFPQPAKPLTTQIMKVSMHNYGLGQGA